MLTIVYFVIQDSLQTEDLDCVTLGSDFNSQGAYSTNQDKTKKHVIELNLGNDNGDGLKFKKLKFPMKEIKKEKVYFFFSLFNNFKLSRLEIINVFLRIILQD